MQRPDYTILEDEQLAELIFISEDRLDLEAAQELARRTSLTPVLAQVVMDKQNWLAELPDWWAVVHASYVLGLQGGEEVVTPLLTALRWADAFDCDWVTELLPSILGRLGPAAIPGLTMVARDFTAGWSARDVAMKGLAAISLHSPESSEHVMRIIGERFMDEGEDRVVRQLAGHVLLDFRCQQYRMALIKFSREEWAFRETDAWYVASLDPEEVEWAFRQGLPDLWHYQEDWMRFYQPAEIQRRQKRWARERLISRGGRGDRLPPPGGGRVLSFWRQGKSGEAPPPPPPGQPDHEGPAGE
ncbi:MAG: hypothetical protein HY910_16235 [Desulfarculus sp.]|nr:hypothetical protein [Desulfarculus sp.]